MAAKNIVAKTWDLPVAWNGRRYSDPANVPEEPSGALYTETWEDAAINVSPDGRSWGSPTNGQWGNGKGSSYASPETEYAYAGSRSCRIAYQGGSGDAAGQLAFDLGGSFREVWISFRLRIPSNYAQRVGGTGTNNKLFRLWPDDGSGGEAGYDYGGKVGASFFREGSDSRSELYGEWNSNNDGIGAKGSPFSGFITADDFGQWVFIEIYNKYASADGVADGIVRIKKDGATMVDLTNVRNNYGAGTKAFRYGYLMGWANTGYAEETRFFLDDIDFDMVA